MITPKLKLCSGCHLPKYIWKSQGKDKFCKECWHKQVLATPIKKSIPSPISQKRRIEQAQYSLARIEFLQANKICRARIVGECTYNATEVHHSKGRVGELFLDKTWWIPLCHNCHCWVTDHSREAIELNLSYSRLEQ